MLGKNTKIQLSQGGKKQKSAVYLGKIVKYSKFVQKLAILNHLEQNTPISTQERKGEVQPGVRVLEQGGRGSDKGGLRHLQAGFSNVWI